MAESNQGPPSESSRRAEEIFADFLVRAERGEETDFEALCLEHPELEDRLRKLKGDWERIASLLGCLGFGGSLATRISERFGPDVDPRISLPDEESEAPASDFSTEVLSRLSARRGVFGRYRSRNELARGGMGAILRVWDEDLLRHLAMKVIISEGESKSGGERDDVPFHVEVRRMARFLEEAQVTGQLDHPGIVPVHDLGLDPDGRIYFTMKLVKGRTLKEILDLVSEGEEEWTQTRVLGLLLRVSEAMAYAHENKHVIHRDLKPANIMVGKYGEVFVMDWGLARFLDRDDDKDLRIRTDPLTSTLRSERYDHSAADPAPQSVDN